MNKRIIYTVLCFVFLLVMFVLSIYGIVLAGIKMYQVGFRSQYLAGIIIYVFVLILVIGVATKLIKEELYRRKFKSKK